MSRARSRFHPRLVPEIRNGYYWLAKDALGLGTTSFKVPDGNKHPAFDLVQATVASQPTLLTENGGVQFRMRKAADAAPSIIKTAAAVQAGWTGATYVAGWFRVPDAAGDITGTGTLFGHQSATAGNFRLVIQSLAGGPPDALRVQPSSTGSDSFINNFAPPFVGAAWHWVEVFFDPALAQASRFAVSSDLVALNQTTAAANPTAIFDASAVIAVACRGGAGLANVDTTDWAACYYGNGIPSLKNRKRLANYLSPVNTKFTI